MTGRFAEKKIWKQAATTKAQERQTEKHARTAVNIAAVNN